MSTVSRLSMCSTLACLTLSSPALFLLWLYSPDSSTVLLRTHVPPYWSSSVPVPYEVEYTDSFDAELQSELLQRLRSRCAAKGIIQPVDPKVVIDCILHKHNTLIHSACGTEQSLNGLGEFRANILGSVAEDLRIVSDPSVRNISYLSTLVCPEWSLFGWNPLTFYHIYAEQHVVLRESTERQTIVWPGRQVFSIEAIHIQKVTEKVSVRIDNNVVIAEARVKKEEEKETEIKREDDTVL
ncbi:hypothetical protein C8R43DRAFT_1148204 [Mycena crocata]|nr:hypothetical protein C8R43DRAFT_1148204 [Mycena crocata]